MAKGQNSAGSQTKSELKTGAERFLVYVTSRALDDNWRTPDDFLRHFKPHDLMTALEKAPDLRATLLVKAAGVHEKIARKKSTSSAAEDLRIALDERVTTAADVLALFPADDRVRYLDKAKLWAFVTEEQFWANDSKDRERGIDRVLFLVEQALDQHHRLAPAEERAREGRAPRAEDRAPQGRAHGSEPARGRVAPRSPEVRAARAHLQGRGRREDRSALGPRER
jgi:uncharacterized protein YhaN